MNGNSSVDKLRLRSSRAWRALSHANLKTVGAVRRSLENGELQHYRNCGPKTLAKICEAVSFEPLKPLFQSLRIEKQGSE
jgi:hypothetical protein